MILYRGNVENNTWKRSQWGSFSFSWFWNILKFQGKKWHHDWSSSELTNIFGLRIRKFIQAYWFWLIALCWISIQRENHSILKFGCDTKFLKFHRVLKKISILAFRLCDFKASRVLKGNYCDTLELSESTKWKLVSVRGSLERSSNACKRFLLNILCMRPGNHDRALYSILHVKISSNGNTSHWFF